jgi:Fe-S cluster assembly ATP-binding protein
LDLSEEILTRNVNVGFSGGQKKKSEIMQMSLFNLSLILLDELDSGLDVDTTKKIVKKIRNNRQSVITIVISHQTDFLQMLQPNKVLILANGQIVKQGDNKLVNLVAKTGFKSLVKASEDNVFVKEDPFRVCHR